MLKKSQKDIRHIQTPALILDIDVFERMCAANYSRVIAKTKIPTKRGHFSFGHRSCCEWFAVAIFYAFCNLQNYNTTLSKSEAGCLHIGQIKSAGSSSPSYM